MQNCPNPLLYNPAIAALACLKVCGTIYKKYWKKRYASFHRAKGTKQSTYTLSTSKRAESPNVCWPIGAAGFAKGMGALGAGPNRSGSVFKAGKKTFNRVRLGPGQFMHHRSIESIDKLSPLTQTLHHHMLRASFAKGVGMADRS